MDAIERFIKSKNDNFSEHSVAKQCVKKKLNLLMERPISNTNQFAQHPLESPKRKMPKSSYSDVFLSELSVVETSKNEALSKEFDPKEYDKNVVDSGDGKVIFIVHLISCDNYVGGFNTDPKDYPSSSMTQLLQAAVPEQTSSQMLAYTPVDLNLPNLNESFTESQVNEYAEYDFDNPENNSLSDMVKTGKEEIHLDGSKTVDDPFVQTLHKQNSEVWLLLYFLSSTKKRGDLRSLG
ncbi:hypothetical protein Tco_1481625 [Tanacetum coccineum]